MKVLRNILSIITAVLVLAEAVIGVSSLQIRAGFVGSVNKLLETVIDSTGFFGDNAKPGDENPGDFRYRVFVYNEQLGIRIDHSDGSNEPAEQ